MDYRAILPQIDACRPGSDDRTDPELADLAAHLAAVPEAQELYDRVQTLDARIAAQFQDVPVPSGLAERLLSGLATAARESTAVPCETTLTNVGLAGDRGECAPQTAGPSATAAAGQRRFRRWLSAAAAGLAVAASVAFALFMLRPPTLYTPDQVVARALQARVQQDDGDTSPAPAGLPSSQLLSSRARVAAGRLAKDFPDCDAAAYELRAGRYKATLYVVKAAVTGLPSSPPPKPSANTGGVAVAAWQEGGLVYVLVVPGGQAEYRRFVDQPRGSVA